MCGATLQASQARRKPNSMLDKECDGAGELFALLFALCLKTIIHMLYHNRLQPYLGSFWKVVSGALVVLEPWSYVAPNLRNDTSGILSFW